KDILKLTFHLLLVGRIRMPLRDPPVQFVNLILSQSNRPLQNGVSPIQPWVYKLFRPTFPSNLKISLSNKLSQSDLLFRFQDFGNPIIVLPSQITGTPFITSPC